METQAVKLACCANCTPASCGRAVFRAISGASRCFESLLRDTASREALRLWPMRC